ncbi:hypothetical protein [Cohaesibacter marisflavi]|uniref:hypothetical protein n=1 Tax=Cohaesibacter marisflavi TaxID=655353 RepID=UPI0029C6F106|nr:hypothetical protein [Cohaesibacter marisflavi]
MTDMVSRATNDKGELVELVRYPTGNYRLFIEGKPKGLEVGRRSGFADLAYACRPLPASERPAVGPELCWIGEGRRYRAETSFGPYVLEYEEAFGHAMGQWRLTGPDGWIYDGFAELEEAKQKALDEFAILLGVAPVPDELLALAKDAWAMAQKAKRKFPQKEGNTPPHDKIAEESGELFKAIIHCAEGRDSLQHVRDEMVDTIAMIFRVHQEGVKANGLPPVKEAGEKDA